MKAKKLLSLVMAASLALGTMATSSALRVNALNPVVGGAELLKDAKSSGADYSTVYYGGVPWRVLDKEFSNGQAEAVNGIYLLSEYAYGHGTYWNAHYGPGDYVWNRTGIYTRLDVQYHPEGYNGNASNTSPTNLGYQESDIRKYMTGVGDYEAVFTRSMHEHGNPDNSGLNVSSYFEKIKVTASEPTPGVVYYVKGDFRLSNHEFNNYKTLTVTAEDWLPDTWYTYDSVTGEYNLVEQAPAAGESLVCYHDASEYYSVGTLEAFEPGVDYYTFEKINDGDPRWDYTSLNYKQTQLLKVLYTAHSQ